MADVHFRLAGHNEAGDATRLLTEFLETDEYYLDSSAGYAKEGHRAGDAVDLLINHPENGAVVIGYDGRRPVSCCVLTYAVSTSAGHWVTKLDDMYVVSDLRRKGVGTAMMNFVVRLLSAKGHRRIDLGVHIRNIGARRFYERLGYRPLYEERLSLLIDPAFAPASASDSKS